MTYTWSILLLLTLSSVFKLHSIINLMIIPILYIFLKRDRKSGIETVLIITFITFLFDHDQYSYGSLKIRIGYIFLPFIYYYLFKPKFPSLIVLLFFLMPIFYAAISIVFPVLDSPSAVKFIFITCPIFLGFYTYQVRHKTFAINLAQYCAPFVIFGLIQFCDIIMHYILNINFNTLAAQSEYYKGLRPSGFFSETTWFSVVALFVFCTTQVKSISMASISMVVFSGSRMTLLPLVLYQLVRSFTKVRFFLYSIFFLAIVALLASYIDLFEEIIYLFFLKLQAVFEGREGRFLAYAYMIDQINFNSLLLPNPFAYDVISFENGSTVGSKAFSLPFYLINNFGAVGVIIFSVFTYKFLVEPIIFQAEGKKILLKYAIFLICLAGPLFQMPFGVALIAVSIRI